MTEQMPSSDQTGTDPIQMQIQKLYMKDPTFEVEGGAEVFKQVWKPELNVNLGVNARSLEDANLYEVVLSIKCQVKTSEAPAFTVAIEQAGIFLLPPNIEEEHKKRLLNGFCPNVLYPYARETVSDLVVKGGFPQLCLAPVNFDVPESVKAKAN
jgi:preprotein translocase subunit SecB